VSIPSCSWKPCLWRDTSQLWITFITAAELRLSSIMVSCLSVFKATVPILCCCRQQFYPMCKNDARKGWGVQCFVKPFPFSYSVHLSVGLLDLRQFLRLGPTAPMCLYVCVSSTYVCYLYDRHRLVDSGQVVSKWELLELHGNRIISSSVSTWWYRP